MISGGVYLNNGSGVFGSNQASAVGLIAVGRGGMSGDFDLDGDLDVIMNVDDRNVAYLRYYVNDLQSANNWLRVKLTGPGGQAGAPGAKDLLLSDRCILPQNCGRYRPPLDAPLRVPHDTAYVAAGGFFGR